MKRPAWVNLLIIALALVAVEILAVGIFIATDTTTKAADIIVFGAGFVSILCAALAGILKLREEGIL